MDANITSPGDYYENLAETYVIFITEKDVLGNKEALYHIDRVIQETGEFFGDEAHILYVNGEYQEDTPLGILMRDFHCTDPKICGAVHWRTTPDTIRKPRKEWRLCAK